MFFEYHDKFSFKSTLANPRVYIGEEHFVSSWTIYMWRWTCFSVIKLHYIFKPRSLTSSEMGVNPGIRRSWKKHLFEWAWLQKASIGGFYFTKKWRADFLRPGLKFDNFKPRLESGIFKCISWLNDSFFESDDRGFLKEGVKTYLMAPISPRLNSPTFFSGFTSIVYGFRAR
jgi:hypothetical protein